MLFEEKAEKNKAAIAFAFRSIVQAKLDQWRYAGLIEHLIGEEIDDENEMVERIAAGVDGAGGLSTEEIMQLVRELATGKPVREEDDV